MNCRKNHQNAPKITIWRSKVKKFSGKRALRHLAPPPHTWPHQRHRLDLGPLGLDIPQPHYFFYTPSLDFLEIYLAPKLSNGTNFNDLEWPLSQISRSRHYSMSNNSNMAQDRSRYNGGPIEAIHGLSNHAIFNDIEWPQTQISRSDHSLMLNISEMARDMAVGHSYYGRWIENRTKLSNGTIFTDLEWPINHISQIVL